MTQASDGVAGNEDAAAPVTSEEQSAFGQITGFIQEHPIACLAGGLAVGALVASLAPRRNREAVARRGSLLAETATAAVAAFAQQAMEQAAAASASVRDAAETVADRTGELGHAAIDRAEAVRDSALAKAQSLFADDAPPANPAGMIARKMRELRDWRGH